MINILKAEFKKFLKTKTFIALAIITIVFPIFTAGMYRVLAFLVGGNDIDGVSDLLNSSMVFMTSFGPMQNYGLILLIMILVFVINDFSQNTIRNKLIAGYSRTKVYLSSAILSLSIMSIAVTIYAFLNYFLTGMLISFGSEGIKWILEFYFFNMTSLLVLYSFIVLMSFIFKKIGSTLGIALGSIFLISMIFNIISLGKSQEFVKVVLMVVPFLKTLSPLLAFETNVYLSMLVNLIYVAGLIGLGILTANKTDFN